MNIRSILFLFSTLLSYVNTLGQVTPILVNRPDSTKTCASAEIHNKNMKEKKYARKTKRFERSLIRAEKRKKRKQRNN
jgi:hypothetical protein